MKQDSSKSYLARLQFDPHLLKGTVAKYITNIRLVVLLMIAIIAIGIYGYVKLPKRLNPEVKIPIVMITTILPGASPEDTESLLTIPLENEIRGIKGIDQLISVSSDNVSVITVQFLSTVPIDKAKDEIQSHVDTITDLPEDAKTPTVNALDFEDQPIWTFALSTRGNLSSLMTFSQQLKRKIEDLSKVDRVTVNGYEDQEIFVRIMPEKISEFGISPFLISQALQKAKVSYPAGNVQTNDNTFSLTIDPQIKTIDDIRKTKLMVQEEIMTLGDIAEISQRSKKDQKATYLAKANQTGRAVVFYVYKTTDVNIDEAGAQIKELVDQEMKQKENMFTVSTINNTADEVTNQFSELLSEFRSTIILIVGCLLIFLGLRQALISSLTVPLTFLSGFFIMTLFNQSINFLTLFAFLIALGLLIDDTVVIVSAMTTYYKTGKFTPTQTGLLVWRDTIVPIWSTTVTTIQSFLPLLIASGIIGEFIKPIPIVVTAVMVSSTGIAVLVTLPFMIILLKPKLAPRVVFLLKIIGFVAGFAVLAYICQGNPFFFMIALLYLLLTLVLSKAYRPLNNLFTAVLHKSNVLVKSVSSISRIFDKGLISIEPLSQSYYRLIIRILNSSKARVQVIIAIIAYSFFSFLLVPLGLVTNEFFPKADSEIVYVNLQMPTGTNLKTTDQETKRILDILKKNPETTFVTAEVGQQFSSNFDRSQNSYSTLFTIHLPKEKDRQKKSFEIAASIREQFRSYTKAKISVVELSSGPPAGADLHIQISGDDLGKLDSYSNLIRQYLEKKSGVANVDVSIKPGTSRFVFVPDKEKLTQYGISVDTIGFWLRSYVSGFTLEEINFDKRYSDKSEIVLHMDDDAINPEDITSLSVPDDNRQNIPLSELGIFLPKTSPSLITREAGKRTISVSAGVLPGFNVPSLNQDLEKYADSLKLEAGYSWKTGGVNEENQESVQSIFQAMAIAFILILITMVLQFQSYRQAAIVLMVIPLAVSSVFVIFALTGTPLSFPALIGVLALFGIVVTNSMFIVDKININRKQGMPFKEAIADAGASRLEPIILTKLNTILGLIPITMSNPLWRGLGGAIISGILFSSIIMLLFIPVMYYVFYHKES